MRASHRLLGLVILVALAACRAPFEASAPPDFAAYDGRAPFRAVSPDGVVYRVRSESPGADGARLEFWSEALRERMEDAGYEVLSDSEIEANGVGGYLLELTAPRGPEDWLYLIAVFVLDEDEDVVVVEAAGEVTRVDARKSDIIAAMRALRFH